MKTLNARFKHKEIAAALDAHDEDELPPGAGILLSMIVGSGLWGLVGWLLWG